MSEPSSYNTFESEEESSGWLMSSESAIDEDEDDLSDELTLLNGDENSDDDSLLDDEFIRLSQRLKEKYKLQEATVGLERCDKIWDTMQLLKNIQRDYDSENPLSGDEANDFHSSRSASHRPEPANSSVPYIKYQPVQGNGNNALPNFYLAVKSQRKVYHCVTCGRQYSERRSLRLHSQKEHGIILPPERHKTRSTGETRTLRPRTPSELGPRGGRDSVADEKVGPTSSKHLLRKPEDTEKDSLVVGSKGPDSTELNQLLGIALECPLCPATFTNQKRLYRHSIDFHAMSVKEARKNRRLKNRKASNIGRKTVSSSESLSETSKSSDSKPELDKHPTKERKLRNPHIRTIDGVKYRYLFTCKSCDKTFVLRKSLRVHMSRHHGLHVPSCKPGGFLAALKKSEIFKAELIKVEDEAILTRSGKSYPAGGSKLQIKRKGIERPKRACASRTSYTECTKREEEVLQKTLAGVPSTPPKTPPGTSDCFLCKRPFADVRKHLIDYHRINSPESILPLAKAEPEEAPEPAEVVPAQTAKPKERRSRESIAAAIEAGEDPRVAVSRSSNRRKTYQCAVCRYKYKNLSTIVKHLKVNTVNGVLQEHECYVRNRHSRSTVKDSVADPVADPLALTDFSEGSKSNSIGTATSEDDDSSSLSRKRTTSSSDERLTPSPEPEAKRRKIEDEIEDSEAIDRAEEESVIALSESDCRSVEEEVTSNHRDTRDSSDRDSGIGISITIKKRNDSYEVVDRDDTRSKETPGTKDDDVALSCDSSTDISNVDFIRDENDRGCENVDSMDCSKDEGVPGTMRTDEGGDVENESETGRSSGEADCGSHGTEGGVGDEAREKNGGNVPSLIVLSRSALNRDESVTMRKTDDLTITHKCPLCCRSYATERDVTIHMLEHKISRSDFRTARLHVIPSSALRRYGRWPV